MAKLRAKAGSVLLLSSLCLWSCSNSDPGSQNEEASKASDRPEKNSGKDEDTKKNNSGSESSEKKGSPEGSVDPKPKSKEPEDEDSGEDSGPLPSVKFDQGAMPEPKENGSGELRPCEIDFLFVVDNSISMEAKQRSLIRSVPKFIDTMLTSNDLEKDFHIGVVTTDAYVHNSEKCQSLGGLVTRVKSKVNPSDSLPELRECGPYKTGRAYMTHEDDLKRSFGCAARPGVMGDINEQQIGALFAAVDPKNGGKGSCNEGFVRKEALLVAVIITDENDLMQKGSPEDWHKQLIQYKGGDSKKVVVVSVVVPEKNVCKDSMSQVSTKIIDFTQRFEKRGFVADVCEDDYDPIFKEAIDVIDFACGQLVDPPG